MFAKIAVAVFVLPLFVKSTVAQCTKNYTIQELDTCDSISAAQNVSTYQLATVNAGVVNSDCTNLEPGATICLGYEGQDCNTTYVVVANDTCDSIDDAFGINATILYGNNPQINQDCTNIYIGEVLCVANTIEAPPAGSSLNTAIPSTATAAVSATFTGTTAASSTTLTDATSAVSNTLTDASAFSTITAAAVSSSAASDSDYTSATSDDDYTSDDDSDEDLPYCDEL